MMSAVPPERRAAIWPWIVMPLIALTSFYYLDKLCREAKEQADLAPPPAAETMQRADTAEQPTP